MLTLLILFALNITTSGELACTGFVQDSLVPMDLYIAGVDEEGTMTFASQSGIVYLNGPKVSTLKTGTVQRVIRPEGRIRDPLTGAEMGIYYKDMGTIQIEAVERGSATARVLSSCQGMLKGDLVVPNSARPAVEFNGDLSNALTALPQDGIVSSILLGKDDARQLAVGHYCFLGLGGRDGVKTGDRFIVFRHNPAFNPRDMATAGTGANAKYSPVNNFAYRTKLNRLLHERTLPPQILGDIVVVEAGGSVSTGRIINSLSEIHPGDFIVKR